jgi:hypothetical protein
MRLTLIALLLAGVAGCDATPADNPGRPVENPKPDTETGGDEDLEDFKAILKESEQGHAGAQLILGDMYLFGHGVPKDEVEAAKWWRKAAEQGDADAQNNLGGMYTNGVGVSKDDVEAYAWYSVAATNGDSYGKESLPRAEARLTPEQLIAAQKRAAELTEKINAKKAD